MKGFISICLMAAFALSASAEKTYKYRVNLKDKQGTAYSVDKPEEFLSERALARRNRQQLSVDETDLPVSQAYVKELQGMGLKLVTCFSFCRFDASACFEKGRNAPHCSSSE